MRRPSTRVIVIAACVVILAVLLVMIFTPGGVYTLLHPFRAARNIGRVSGEVFLLDSDGKVHAAPGASVTFYEADSKHNWVTFYDSDRSRRDKADEKADEAFKKAMAPRVQIETKETEADLAAAKAQADSYESMAQHERDSFCMRTGSEVISFFERVRAVETTDKEGRFSADLPSGWFRPRQYTVVVEGEAGQQNAIWIQDVDLKWRSQVRLVSPYCTYRGP